MSKMVEVTMSIEEYEALMTMLRDSAPSLVSAVPEATKPKRKTTSKYRRTYNRNFRLVESNYKSKNGKWLKDGFKKAVRASHRKTKNDLK